MNPEKRSIYNIVLFAIIVGLSLSWYGSRDTLILHFLNFTQPFTVGACILCLYLLRRNQFRVVETIAGWTCIIYVLMVHVGLLSPGDFQPIYLQFLAPVVLLAASILLIVFEWRPAIAMIVGMYVVHLVLTIVLVVRFLGSDKLGIELYVELVVVIALILLVMLSVYQYRHAAVLTYAQTIERLAYTDSLTQIANRHALYASLEYALSAQRPMCLALLDIDDFKRINDQQGHNVGDQVLQGVAQTMKEVAPTSLIGRWGGEEFLMLAEDGTALLSDLHRVRAGVAALDVAGQHITVSIGATSLQSGDTQATAIARADALMYRAKAEGKNRVLADFGPEAVRLP
ncbi:GGDEF domain-containing protein [Deinococcus sp. KNUC1210]|uniref:GGDEF domain-containing protein n=1 Tax=Deinococcus sp. KNUC1210 TaxID=2917691 RepID=UPI001EF159EF|nr:GGDEF domain-containing protein [Deinococcus sp. KNUC1210]ULH16163.1 GGDEF domain-containing protein [Deinococcus sp. KNUC1210]